MEVVNTYTLAHAAHATLVAMVYILIGVVVIKPTDLAIVSCENGVTFYASIRLGLDEAARHAPDMRRGVSVDVVIARFVMTESACEQFAATCSL